MSGNAISDIPGDYDVLKVEYILLKQELDETKQELYANKRNVQLLEVLQNDYQSEVEMLQCKMDGEKKVLEEKITKLEDYNVNLKQQFNKKIQSLELTLTTFEKENVAFQNEIEILKKINSSSSDENVISKLNEEIFNLRDENLKISHTSDHVQLSFEELQKQNATLENAIVEVKQEIDELNKKLCCKEEKLQDANQQMEKFNEELIFLKNELAKNIKQPQIANKGNSLFAEVDDRRVCLQKTVNTMKSEYIVMKQERAKHLRDIHHLKIENKTLLQKWKADMNEKYDDQDTELKSYKDRVRMLEDLMESYKKDLNSKQTLATKDSFEGFEFYSALIGNKNKQIDELRQQLSSRSLTETLLSKALSEANEEKRKWKLEAALKKNEVELLLMEGSNLKVEIDQTKSKSTSTNDMKLPLKSLSNETNITRQTQNRNKSKSLYKVENTVSEMNSIQRDIIETTTQKKDLDCIIPKVSIRNRKLTENDMKPEETQSNSDEKTLDELIEEITLHSKAVDNNISVIELENDSCEGVCSNESTIVIKTEKGDSNVTGNSEEEHILGGAKEENICDGVKEEKISSVNIDVNDNKENVNVLQNTHAERSDLTRKVTFANSKVTPKKTGLRKCKKIIVCKPVLFNSSLK